MKKANSTLCSARESRKEANEMGCHEHRFWREPPRHHSKQQQSPTGRQRLRQQKTGDPTVSNPTNSADNLTTLTSLPAHRPSWAPTGYLDTVPTSALDLNRTFTRTKISALMSLDSTAGILVDPEVPESHNPGCF
ncbi:hypothetical protein NQ317_004399 [Molorchus minor]|uniref:Uncharacterized protein n=1 Tax=Molorchus minor TaxID=1323400 RepID=A0ABQ9ISF1_9CUCU|nr:hypothetical protein NQ317_004399 [Molorchus minor]